MLKLDDVLGWSRQLVQLKTSPKAIYLTVNYIFLKTPYDRQNVELSVFEVEFVGFK